MTYTITINLQDVLSVISLVLYLLSFVTWMIFEDGVVNERDLGVIDTIVIVTMILSAIGAVFCQVGVLCL